MKQEINIDKQLANKFYLTSVGLYAALASVFLFIYLLQTICNLNSMFAIVIGFFVTVIWRTFYDQLVIYGLKIKQINFINNFILAVISAISLAVIYYFIKAPLGDWSIPVTIIISMRIIANIRKFLWPIPNKNISEILRNYQLKIHYYIRGLYSFFLGVALFTYYIVKLFGLNWFCLAFAIGILLGLIIEQLYEFKKIYNIKLTKFIIIMAVIIAIIFAILCTILFVMFTHKAGFSGKIATIVSIILTKLLQPLVSRLLIKDNAG